MWVRGQIRKQFQCLIGNQLFKMAVLILAYPKNSVTLKSCLWKLVYTLGTQFKAHYIIIREYVG